LTATKPENSLVRSSVSRMVSLLKRLLPSTIVLSQV
jgi:hypothetical protein